MLKRIEKGIMKADDILGIIGGIILLGIMLFICADVFSRAVFNKPFPGSVEICALAVVYVIYFGLGYGLTRGAHVRVTLISSHLPKTIQWIYVLIAYLV